MKFLRAFRDAAAADAAGTDQSSPGTEPAVLEPPTFEPPTFEPPTFEPPVSLLLPMRGLDPGLDENLDAFFRQDYGDYQVLLVTDTEGDPSFEAAERAVRRHPDVPSRLLVAGRAEGRGQKVHNLLHALDHVREGDQVLAFGDSDIRPSPEWLRRLVAPLADPDVGVSTGYRWHMPRSGSLASALRSVWNAGIASLMTGDRPPFAWGGAMALRREAFREAGIRDRWQRTLSDDYALTRAIEERELAILFEPRALSFTYGSCSLGELLDWSFRQLAITRVYRPTLWRLAIAGELFGNLTLWGGLALLVAAGATGSAASARLLLLAALLVGAYAARGVKGWLRIRGVIELFPESAAELRRWLPAYVLGTPFASLVTLAGLLRSAFTREICWRGTRYRMISPTHTEVLN